MSVNRRFFLFGSALAAHAFQSEKPVGTGMIGVGNRGSFLLQGVVRQPNAKVLALCDIKPDRLDKAASAAVRDNPVPVGKGRRVIPTGWTRRPPRQFAITRRPLPTGTGSSSRRTWMLFSSRLDRKSTRLNSSPANIS